MKIIQIQTQAEAGGAQRVSQQLSRSLTEKGHDVRTVFLYRKTAAFDDDSRADILMPTVPNGSLQRLRAVAALIPYLVRQKPDAIITFQHYGNVFGAIAGSLTGCSRIIANQNGVPGLVGTPWAGFADKVLGTLGLYQANVVNSDWTRQQFAEYPLAYQRRIVAIPHGLAPNQRAPISKAQAQRTLGLPTSMIVALSAGRLATEKNQLALLPLLAARSDMVLAIAGDGPLRGELLLAASKLGVADRLYLIGELPPDRMGEFMAAGDVFLFSSQWETFGLAAVEAAIAGLPVVANDLPVLRETLGTKAGRAAWFADFGNTEVTLAALANALSDSADVEPAARELAERYSHHAMAEAYLALCHCGSH